MTKAKLQEKYKEWNRNIGILDRKADEAFTELQELNAEYGTGERWCNAFMNLKGLIGTAKETRAEMLYNQIQQARGQMESLRELALATNNFEI